MGAVTASGACREVARVKPSLNRNTMIGHSGRLRDYRASRWRKRYRQRMFAKVYEAFLDYELILFRDVDLPPATSRLLGEVQIHVLSQITWTREDP